MEGRFKEGKGLGQGQGQMVSEGEGEGMLYQTEQGNY